MKTAKVTQERVETTDTNISGTQKNRAKSKLRKTEMSVKLKEIA